MRSILVFDLREPDRGDEQQRELELLPKQSPSLKRYFAEVLDKVELHARQQVGKEYPKVQFRKPDGSITK